MINNIDRYDKRSYILYKEICLGKYFRKRENDIETEDFSSWKLEYGYGY